MKRGTAIAAGAGALVLGAVVLAAIGVIPDPFDPDPIDIVDSGTGDAAKDAGEQKLPGDAPDPFDTPRRPIEIVESGGKDARTAGELREGEGGSPFDIPIDIVESGSDKAREAGEMRPLDPIADPFDDIDARARRDAAFAADSRFPRNPEGDVGTFRFDWVIDHRIDTRDALADFSYHVNSADGSWLVQGADIRHLLPEGSIPGAQLDFLLRKGNGDVLACGKHRDVGPACTKLGNELPYAFAWLSDATKLRAFLDSVRRTPQTLGPGPGGGRPGVRGRMNAEGSDRYLQVWVDRAPSPIATQVPWLGMGAGVLKDHRARVNRVVRRVRFEGADLEGADLEGADLDGGDVVVDLLRMSPGEASRSTVGYRLVTAFTMPAIEEANALGASLAGLQEQAREIQAALDACPKGTAGRDCRKTHRARMKQLNEDAKRRALEFGERHGLPVE